MAAGLHSVAQTSAPSRELPDAPSARQQAERTAPAEPVKDESSLGLLVKRSRVFPDLATSKGPLTSGEKFKLSVNNTLSPASVAGSLLGAGLSQAMDSYRTTGKAQKDSEKGLDRRWGGPLRANFLGPMFSRPCCTRTRDIFQSRTQR